MPHGGYHGTVVMGGNIIQQGDGQGGIQGGLGQAALNIPVNQPSQTAAQATAAAQAKKKEIEERFPIQVAAQTGAPSPLQTAVTVGPAGQTTTGTIADVPGFGADDAKAAYMQFQNQNQQLNNLLIAEQQAKNREGIIRAAQQGVLNASDLTGTTGGPFGLNIPALGATDTTISGIGSVQNPFTAQELPEQVKAREGLTTPQYNQFIQELYGANPELYQETFPFASGQMAKPILARIGEGIMNLPGASEIGQLAGDVGSAIGSVFPSGIFSGKKTATPKIQYDNMGNPVGIISQLPESDGGDFDINTPKLDLGQYSAIPEEYKGFFESEFAKPVAGGMAITYVTLPDGSKVKFGDTGSAAQFRKYLESISAIKSESTEDYPEGYGAFLLNPPAPVRPGTPTIQGFPDKDGDGVDDRYQTGPGIPRPGIENVGPLKPKTNLPAAFDYASIAPQFTGSQYTNQGVSPAFLENLRRFYG